MKKYNILVDLDRLKDLNTGLGHVAQHFGRAISKISHPDMNFTCLVPKNFIGYFGNQVEYETLSLKRRYFPSFCKNFDLWYTIHQDSSYFPANRNTPFVLTINDLNFLGEKTPDKAKIRLNRLQKKVNRTHVITVISKFTETAVRQNLNIGQIPIHVIYCGVEVVTFDNPKRPEFAPDGDILFCVGVVQSKKNYMVLPEFIKRLPENYKLVIAGNKSGQFASDLQQKINQLGLENRIFLPGLISEEAKFWFYQNCKAVLFPSKFEGMGFPPVEAMRNGKPVFASTFSSIPEVSEDKAYYWENFEPDYMASFFLQKIEEFTKNKDLPQVLKKHSLKYTWDNNAAQYIELFEKILSK